MRKLDCIYNHLIIGLGGTGGRVLKEFRKQLYEEFGEIPNGISFAYIDSTDEMMKQDDPSWNVMGRDVRLSHSEFLNISPQYDGGIIPKQLQDLLESCKNLKSYQPNCGAMQDRRLGRALLGIHATEFHDLLRYYVQYLHEQTTHLDVTIVTGLSGGTGSGIVVDVISILSEHCPKSTIKVMAVLPDLNAPAHYNRGRYFANAYAALKELNALNVGLFKPHDIFNSEKTTYQIPDGRLFTLLLFESDMTEASLSSLANILFRLIHLNQHFYDFELSRHYFRYLHEGYLPLIEYGVENNHQQYVSTRAVASLGIKYISYPRKRIVQYLGHNVIEQALLQMLYNNYKEDIGFVDEIPCIDYMSLFLKDYYIERWHLDNRSITLQKPILNRNDRDIRPFADTWDRKLFFLRDYRAAKVEAEKQGCSSNFQLLYDNASNIYLEDFRSHKGVNAYYTDKKRNAQVYAREIVSVIERTFFEKWLYGEFGLFQLQKVCDALRNYLHRRIDLITQWSDNLVAKIDVSKETCDLILDEIRHMTLILIKIKELSGEMQKKYDDLWDSLIIHYSARAEMVSHEFAQQLLQALLCEIGKIDDHLRPVIHILTRMVEESQMRADDFLRNSELQDYIDLSNHKYIEHYKNIMLTDKEYMQSITSIIRTQLLKETKNSFIELVYSWENKTIDNLPMDAVFESIKVYDYNHSIAADIQDHFHQLSPQLCSSICENNIYSIFGKIMDEGEDAIMSVFTACLQNNSNVVRLNHNELVRVVPNNHPVRDSYSFIFVTMPKPKTEDEKKVFLRLTDIFKSQIPSVRVGTTDYYDEELSVTRLICGFPIRAIEMLPFLKQEYVRFINNNQDINALHIEDSLANLPSLEIEEL